jgi:hypothetical protein
MMPSAFPLRLSLDVIDVARPCPLDWNEMRGDERVRFCGHCSLHVYNLSTMSRTAAERLVRETEGRVCVRFYRRVDGTVTTRDCGIKAAAKRLGQWAGAGTAVALSALVAALGWTRASSACPIENADRPFRLAGQPPPPPPPQPPIMGKIRAPSSQPVMIMGDLVATPPPTSQPARPTTQPARSE